MSMAPSRILGVINWTNVPAPEDFAADGTARIALGQVQPSAHLGGHFPSLDARREWKQPFDPEGLDDAALTVASGWVLDPQCVKGDVPFSHPFGFDFEFFLAVDDDPNYTQLLARANQVPEDNDPHPPAVTAANLNIPVPTGPDGKPSFLTVEADGGLVPVAFTEGNHVGDGDRAVVAGRWIVDCGHDVKDALGAPYPCFRAEIHPPMFMATGRVVQGSLVTGGTTGPDVTRVLLTSRPYLPSQHYTTNPDRAYFDQDDADDGQFVDHLLHEIVKVNDTIFGFPNPHGGSTFVECHPKIRSVAYVGPAAAHFVIRTPAPPPGGGHGALGGATPPQGNLAIAYQFTVRSDVAVQVDVTDTDTVEVRVVAGRVTSPPPLPARHERAWTAEDLNALDHTVAAAVADIQWISAGLQLLNPLSPIIGIPTVEAILARGMKADEYDTSAIRGVDVLDASHVRDTGASAVVTDDTQPYPIYGWIEVAWVDPQMTTGTPEESQGLPTGEVIHLPTGTPISNPTGQPPIIRDHRH